MTHLIGGVIGFVIRVISTIFLEKMVLIGCQRQCIIVREVPGGQEITEACYFYPEESLLAFD